MKTYCYECKKSTHQVFKYDTSDGSVWICTVCTLDNFIPRRYVDFKIPSIVK